MKNICCTLLVLFFVNSKAAAWDTQQLEVFDVVEEIKENFYNFLSVPQDADTQTIKSAFRKLSLTLHPDKNAAEDAEQKFRNLVSIYDVLKDTTKRNYYDEVLLNGLPNWRSAIYYYRHVRRIGLLELCLFLFVLISICQYIVGWAAYYERKYTLDQVRGKKQKKIVATIELPKPSLLNTLPVQIPILFWKTVISIPWILNTLKSKALEKLEREEVESSEEEPIQHVKTVRKRKPAFEIPNGPTFEIPHTKKVTKQQVPSEINIPPVTGGLWTDDDLSELVQLINRYPGGTPNRWEVISTTLGRSVPEVTYMANKIKGNNFRIATQEHEEEELRVKKKTKGGKFEATEQNQTVWSQEQQKAMENALAKFPKGALDRWDCIADCVQGKTKEQCILRYKYLVEVIKKQKETQITENM